MVFVLLKFIGFGEGRGKREQYKGKDSMKGRCPFIDIA